MGDKISRPAVFVNSKLPELRRRSLSSPINRSNILVAASYQAVRPPDLAANRCLLDAGSVNPTARERELREAKEKSSGALRKFRKCGTTILQQPSLEAVRGECAERDAEKGGERAGGEEDAVHSTSGWKQQVSIYSVFL